MYLTGSGSSITANRISGTLSAARSLLAATTITYNGIDYAVFGGGNGSDVVDFMYLTGSGNSITANRISGTLSTPRYNLGATTITYNGVEYAVFGGGAYGSKNSDVVDFMYLTTEDNKIKINKISETLSEARADLAATTITYNGIDYAAFGGGTNDVVDFMYLDIDPTSTII